VRQCSFIFPRIGPWPIPCIPRASIISGYLHMARVTSDFNFKTLPSIGFCFPSRIINFFFPMRKEVEGKGCARQLLFWRWVFHGRDHDHLANTMNRSFSISLFIFDVFASFFFFLFVFLFPFIFTYYFLFEVYIFWSS
jgi:hypothetical protein